MGCSIIGELTTRCCYGDLCCTFGYVQFPDCCAYRIVAFFCCLIPCNGIRIIALADCCLASCCLEGCLFSIDKAADHSLFHQRRSVINLVCIWSLNCQRCRCDRHRLCSCYIVCIVISGYTDVDCLCISYVCCRNLGRVCRPASICFLVLNCQGVSIGILCLCGSRCKRLAVIRLCHILWNQRHIVYDCSLGYFQGTHIFADFIVTFLGCSVPCDLVGVFAFSYVCLGSGRCKVGGLSIDKAADRSGCCQGLSIVWLVGIRGNNCQCCRCDLDRSVYFLNLQACCHILAGCVLDNEGITGCFDILCCHICRCGIGCCRL